MFFLQVFLNIKHKWMSTSASTREPILYLSFFFAFLELDETMWLEMDLSSNSSLPLVDGEGRAATQAVTLQKLKKIIYPNLKYSLNWNVGRVVC